MALFRLNVLALSMMLFIKLPCYETFCLEMKKNDRQNIFKRCLSKTSFKTILAIVFRWKVRHFPTMPSLSLYHHQRLSIRDLNITCQNQFAASLFCEEQER